MKPASVYFSARWAQSLIWGLTVLFLLFGITLSTQAIIPTQLTQSLPIQAPFSFVAMGDMGSGLAGQMELAQALNKQYKEKPYPMVLLLGDNLYPNGDPTTYGQARFSVPYKYLLEHNVLFEASLGNHDVDSGFKKQNMTFFHMPSSYYDFIAGGIHFFAIDTNQFDKTEQRWLAGKLAQAPEHFKIVFGHHPVFSSGMHGTSIPLEQTLKPILEKNHVQLYLCGHDHDYERFAPVNGVTYIVSGGGGASLRHFEKRDKGSLLRDETYEFVRFDYDGTHLLFNTVDSKNQRIDSGEMN